MKSPRPIYVACFVALSSALCGCQQNSQASILYASAPSTAIYFSPTVDMDDIDIQLIESAQHTLDIAMYAFTDMRIAVALRQAAERDVHIRLYRDHDQYAQEMRRGGRVMALLAHQPNIQIRVKGSYDLMHEKAFLIDGTRLRDGSGNWSVSAARYQDNQVSTTTEPSECADFAADFAAMWDRPSNLVVQ